LIRRISMITDNVESGTSTTAAGSPERPCVDSLPPDVDISLPQAAALALAPDAPDAPDAVGCGKLRPSAVSTGRGGTLHQTRDESAFVMVSRPSPWVLVDWNASSFRIPGTSQLGRDVAHPRRTRGALSQTPLITRRLLCSSETSDRDRRP
jgi:hypothetical protein